MAAIRAILVRGAIAAGLIHALMLDAHGGLSAPPKSHVVPMPDGRHMLVFLSDVPVEEDEGRLAKLPDGTEVDLRSTFQASGCYEIATRKPLWTAPWDSSDFWSVSEDCRFLVRWNEFGDGSYWPLKGGRLSWGIKLYDRGREIMTYDVAELVDYPSLMPFTSSDYHHDWLDWDCVERLIQGEELIVQTSTHERYRIDLRTGAIVEEFRMWRTLARAGTTLAAVIGVGFVALIVRRPNRTAIAVAQAPVELLSPTDAQPISCGTRRFLSFSLRTLLLAMTAAAFLCGFGYRWPHVVLLVGSLMVATLLTRRVFRLCRGHPLIGGRRRRTAKVWWYAFATAITWIWCYILSAPPLIAFIDWLRAPDDVRMAIGLTIYRPFFWIQYYGGSDLLTPLEWYFEAW